MPRNVRNFWIDLEIDGRKTPVATGPRSKNGGFVLLIRMRELGGISTKAVRITGRVESDGSLSLLAGTTAIAEIFADEPGLNSRLVSNPTFLLTAKR